MWGAQGRFENLVRITYLLTRIRWTIFGLGLGLENFPWKSQILEIFPLRFKKFSSIWLKKFPINWVKDRLPSYLLRAKSILGSSQGQSLYLNCPDCWFV